MLGIKNKKHKYSMPADWIESTLYSINKDAQEKEETILFSCKIDDSTSDVCYSLDDDYFENVELDKPGRTFQQNLFALVMEKYSDNSEFYKAAHIDRKLFSAINKNVHYKPKKETAVLCCLGLGLNKTEADMLLASAGFCLSDAIEWDRIISYCIKHGICDVDKVNDLLVYSGYKAIGK